MVGALILGVGGRGTFGAQIDGWWTKGCGRYASLARSEQRVHR